MKKISSFIMSLIIVLSTLFNGMITPVMAATNVIKGFDNLPAYDFAIKNHRLLDLSTAEVVSKPDSMTYFTTENLKSFPEDLARGFGVKSLKKGSNDLGTLVLRFPNVVIDGAKDEYDLQLSFHSVWESPQDVTLTNGYFAVINNLATDNRLWVSGDRYVYDKNDDAAIASVTPTLNGELPVPDGLTAQSGEDDNMQLVPISRIRQVEVPSIEAYGCQTTITVKVLKHNTNTPVNGKLYFSATDLDTIDLYQMEGVDKVRYYSAENKRLYYGFGKNYKYNESINIDGDVYIDENSWLVADDNGTVHATRQSANDPRSQVKSLINANNGSITHYISQGATQLFAQPTAHNVTYEVIGDFPNGGTIDGKTSGSGSAFDKQTVSYTITPTPGYEIDKLIVDGEEVDPTDTITFERITSDHDIKVSFKKAPEAAQVVYKTNTGIVLEESDKLTGESNTSIDYDTTEIIKKYTDSGYKLNKDEFSDSDKTFDDDPETDQEFVVELEPIIEPVTPDTPKSHTEQMNPNGDPYPEGLTEEDLVQTVTRTIKYVDENDNQMKDNSGNPIPDKIQTITFTRTATVNHVTGEVIYTEWTTEDDTFDAVNSPVVNGWTFDKDIEEVIVTIDTNDMNEVVTYRPDTQKASIKFVDENGNEVATQYDFSGKSGEAFTYDPISTINEVLAKHYEVVSNDYPENGKFDYDTDVDQNYTVVFKLKTYTVTFVDGFGTTLKVEPGILYGGSATAPEDPTKEGYKFTGWDIAYNNVTNDLTVTAQWKELPKPEPKPEPEKPTPSPVTPVTPDPQVKPILTLTKAADQGKVTKGNTVTYTITVNVKEADLTEAYIVDIWDAEGFILDKTTVKCSRNTARISYPSDHELRVDFGDMKKDETITVSYSGKINKLGNVLNTVNFGGSNADDISTNLIVEGYAYAPQNESISNTAVSVMAKDAKTGDTNNILMYTAFASLALGTLLYGLRKKKYAA